jgi:hypothetical protein
MIEEHTMKNEKTPYESCRRVADEVFLRRHNYGLKVPSAADDEINLVIYPDITKPEAWEINEITKPDRRIEITEELLLEYFPQDELPRFDYDNFQ